MLPELAMVAGFVDALVDVGIPRGLVGRCRVGANAVGVTLIGELGTRRADRNKDR